MDGDHLWNNGRGYIPQGGVTRTTTCYFAFTSKIQEALEMVRVRLLTLLLVIAFCSAWLATFHLEMSLGIEIRKLLWIFILAPSIASVIYYRGQQQAFWFGFSLVVVLRALPSQWGYSLAYASISNWVIRYCGANQDLSLVQFIDGTVTLVFTIGLGVACGFMFSTIYRSATQQEE